MSIDQFLRASWTFFIFMWVGKAFLARIFFLLLSTRVMLEIEEKNSKELANEKDERMRNKVKVIYISSERLWSAEPFPLCVLLDIPQKSSCFLNFENSSLSVIEYTRFNYARLRVIKLFHPRECSRETIFFILYFGKQNNFMSCK